ncbi:pachytene checkpoint protein 2 homolog [Rhopilema esculentum]|uniref:pachytene checkpoint protein 2 homolog n=1 Tax=Rhopilema esculentum TaxID=499914 RepID=UPI0031E142B5
MDNVPELNNALPMPEKYILHPEVCLLPSSSAMFSKISAHAYQFLMRKETIISDTVFTEFDDEFLTQNAKCISITDLDLFQNGCGINQVITINKCELKIHVYKLYDEGPAMEEVEDEDISAANHWVLPADELHGLWDSLVYDADIKFQLLNYAYTTLLFSDRGIDSNIISWNRVILLHGPPGTGKTSLCKALAQKLTIRLSDRFTHGQLVEINSHSLFSKWFSESGKLVLKMFARIQELIDDSNALVLVLIDEVESLTAARASAMKGSEPSDAIRVVNALLTQLDQIKRCPNVIILTTSNITGAIDLAFVDRADIKQYIGPPSVNAIYTIYLSCIRELIERKIVYPAEQLLTIRSLELMRFVDNAATHSSLLLREIARKSHGLSGRALRKLPFLAHALYIQSSTVSLSQFLEALSKAVDKQLNDRKTLNECDGAQTDSLPNGNM